jgi:hypothetical protein
MAGREIPERRIYSITFVHDGEEWTATIDEQLRGIKTSDDSQQGTTNRTTYPISDTAMVLA